MHKRLLAYSNIYKNGLYLFSEKKELTPERKKKSGIFQAFINTTNRIAYVDAEVRSGFVGTCRPFI